MQQLQLVAYGEPSDVIELNRVPEPACGKVGIRLVAFTDAAGVLHMIGTAPMPYDSS